MTADIILPFGPRRKELFEKPAASFVRVEPRNVQLLTLKRADWGGLDDYVLRLLEVGGRKCTAKVWLPARVGEAVLCDVIERPKGGRPSGLKPLSVELGPHEVVTVLLSVKGRSGKHLLSRR